MNLAPSSVRVQLKLNRQVTLGHLSLRILLSPSRSSPFGSETIRLFGPASRFPSAGGFRKSWNLLLVIPAIRSQELSAGQTRDRTDQEHQRHLEFSTLAPTSDKANDSVQFSLDNLELEHGEVGLTDQLAAESRAVYNGINLDFDGYEPDKRFCSRTRAHLAGSGAAGVCILKERLTPIPRVMLPQLL
jgi:hypothetical protein